MDEYQRSLFRHTRDTMDWHRRQSATAAAGQGLAVLPHVVGLSQRVDGFIKGFPKRVQIKKGINYRRMSIALLVYLIVLGCNAWFFNRHNLFDMQNSAEIAKVVFRNAQDYTMYAHYVYWTFVLLFSLLSMAVAFLGIMVICLLLSVFRFKWVNALFEALGTAVGSAGVTYVYYHYLPFLQGQIDKVFT